MGIPIITAFRDSPDRGQGLARDMRLRWALEEVGQPYDVRLLTFEDMKQPAHLALQPFGQIPTYEEDGLALFETGAIILHLAETRPGLLPHDPGARSRAITWMFAALNTVEPPIVEREMAMILDRDQPWHQQRLPILEENIRKRLAALSGRLGQAAFLEGGFSAGDLLMMSVLARIGGSDLLAEWPNLAAYQRRGEDRPAYRRAFAAQLAVFRSAGGDRSS